MPILTGLCDTALESTVHHDWGLVLTRTRPPTATRPSLPWPKGGERSNADGFFHINDVRNGVDHSFDVTHDHEVGVGEQEKIGEKWPVDAVDAI